MKTAVTALLIIAAYLAIWRTRRQRDARIAYLQGCYLSKSREARCNPRRTARILDSLASNYAHSYEACEVLQCAADYWAIIELDSPYLMA